MRTCVLGVEVLFFAEDVRGGWNSRRKTSQSKKEKQLQTQPREPNTVHICGTRILAPLSPPTQKSYIQRKI